jgi:alpha-amylase
MMKRLLTFVLGLLMTTGMMAQGWPAQYKGVMLQGFYWDSYSDTKWTNLESQADELAAYFDLIWVPNSAYANSLSNNMGYHPVYWFDHKSAFGTEAQLRSMISTFKAKGLGTIEDVVINHRASVNSNWLNFPKETYKGVDYQLTAADICSDDESKDNGYTPTGAKDTGMAWDGARDLDHKSENVQKNVLAYEDKLLNDLGYVGFRYDFVKGYHGSYVGLYNKTMQPEYSVGECWDGNKTVVTNWINATKQDGVIQSAAFDFPLKYYINDAFASGKWSRLNGGCLADDNTYKRYSVTFVDNHDTGRFGECPLYANVEAANAYILTMPGTPCVWLSHWKTYKSAIKRLITIRRAVGIHNQSTIQQKTASNTGYVLKVEGTEGTALLLLGSATAATDGMKLAVEGENYKLYVSEAVDLSALSDIKDEQVTLPSFCTVNEGETCAFFEAPTSGWTTVKCWAWDSANNYTGGAWPGAACTKVGTNNGHSVYKWTYSGTLTTLPTYIIFNNNNNGQQTPDLVFKNGGYYSESGTLLGVVGKTTGIESISRDPSPRRNGNCYDLRGRKVSTPAKGIYIVGGRKVVVK